MLGDFLMHFIVGYHVDDKLTIVDINIPIAYIRICILDYIVKEENVKYFCMSILIIVILYKKVCYWKDSPSYEL